MNTDSVKRTFRSLTSWSTEFTQDTRCSVRNPVTSRDKKYAAFQEGIRKDVERFFGIIKGCFQILQKPSKKRSRKLLGLIVATIIILHNMRVKDQDIGEDEGKDYETDEEEIDEEEVPGQITPEMRQQARERMNELENWREHNRLQEALKDSRNCF